MFRYLAEGDTRVVFVDEELGLVRKVVKSDYGYAANSNELLLSRYVSNPYIPKNLKRIDKDTIEMPYFEPYTLEEIPQDKYLDELVNVFGVMDVMKRENWGILDSKPILLDFGLNNDVFIKPFKLKRIIWQKIFMQQE